MHSQRITKTQNNDCIYAADDVQSLKSDSFIVITLLSHYYYYCFYCMCVMLVMNLLSTNVKAVLGLTRLCCIGNFLQHTHIIVYINIIMCNMYSTNIKTKDNR